MGEVLVDAPRNPYRRDGHVNGVDLAWRGYATPAPRAHDTEAGPGITAGDLDRIARDHHRDGYAKAEREAEAKLEAMQAQLARAYDEGYTAGRAERAQGLASDVYARLIEPSVGLTGAMDAPKSKVAERLPAVKAALTDVTEFLLAMMGREGESRAAAQIARDEA